MSIDGLGARVAQRWVQLYTSRLPPDQAGQRCDEILSDLWEHLDDSIQSGHSRLRHNVHVIERVLSGIPADLSWRRGIQRSQMRPETGDLMTTQQTISRSNLMLTIMAGVGIAVPFGNLAFLGTGLKTSEVLWILGSITLAGLLAVGLVLHLTTNRPSLATILLLVGSFAPSAAWFWLPPIYLLTVAIIVVALVITRARSVVQPRAN